MEANIEDRFWYYGIFNACQPQGFGEPDAIAALRLDIRHPDNLVPQMALLEVYGRRFILSGESSLARFKTLSKETWGTDTPAAFDFLHGGVLVGKFEYYYREDFAEMASS